MICNCFYIIDEPMKWEELKLRAEDDYSVDMDITDCGICGSDIHTMDANWGVPKYPVCVVSFQLHLNIEIEINYLFLT